MSGKVASNGYWYRLLDGFSSKLTYADHRDLATTYRIVTVGQTIHWITLPYIIVTKESVRNYPRTRKYN